MKRVHISFKSGGIPVKTDLLDLNLVAHQLQLQQSWASCPGHIYLSVLCCAVLCRAYLSICAELHFTPAGGSNTRPRCSNSAAIPWAYQKCWLSSVNFSLLENLDIDICQQDALYFWRKRKRQVKVEKFVERHFHIFTEFQDQLLSSEYFFYIPSAQNDYFSFLYLYSSNCLEIFLA